ncbi:hypothetical protein ACNPQM_33295 [Streptomyces sp. NPDC056231]|uniref:hypothetical protein n=1 Tax=Streptomyces sp. NPDC056231 TaxID=3345755 RepID=UPI003AAECC9D
MITALIGALGHNPRKGPHGSMQDVQRELLDVAAGALLAVAHLHAQDARPPDITVLLAEHIEQVAERSGIKAPQ